MDTQNAAPVNPQTTEQAVWVPAIPGTTQPPVPTTVPKKGMPLFLKLMIGCGALFFILPILFVILIVAIKPAEKLEQAKKELEKTASSSAKQASSFVIPSNWKTYSASNGMSFKYPTNWTINNVAKTPSSLGYVVVKSPNGFFLNFVDNEEIGDLGGGCGENVDSTNNDYVFKVNVYGIKPIGLTTESGNKISVVEWSVSGGSLRSRGVNFQRKEIQLNHINDYPKLGDNGEGCLLYEDTVFGELSGVFFDVYKGARFHGRYPDDSPYQKLSPTEYFNLSEVKTAETIIASIKLSN